ncbi:MAG TPA: hypothetical protein VGE98_16830 [Thermoanaerobaculia bacterium]
MRRVALSLCCLCLAAAASPAGAGICFLDTVPAATLLLPYFQVDLNDPNGETTLFSVNNSSQLPVLAKVEVWSDLGVAIFGFDVYLNAYDVQTINLRDVLAHGMLPQTQPLPGTFQSCAGALPPPPLPPSMLASVQSLLTGQPSVLLDGRCAGRDLGDGFARGYVTADVVSACSTQFQGDTGYFGEGGTGIPTNQNVLFGDYFFINPGNNTAEGGQLAHIEADGDNPETTVGGNYTFYGRFTSWTAVDNREPLGTNFAVRFLNGGAFTGGSDLVVWRDPKVRQDLFDCPAQPGIRPSWYPLGQERLIAFDESGSPIGLDRYQPFPAVTQRVHVGGPDLPVPFTCGWLYLDLNTTVAAAGSNPPEDSQAAQGWVSVLMEANGHFGVGFDALKLDSACQAKHLTP